MSLLGGLFKAAVSIVVTPVAVVSDTLDVLGGETPRATEKTLESIIDNTSEAIKDLSEGKII